MERKKGTVDSPQGGNAGFNQFLGTPAAVADRSRSPSVAHSEASEADRERSHLILQGVLDISTPNAAPQRVQNRAQNPMDLPDFQPIDVEGVLREVVPGSEEDQANQRVGWRNTFESQVSWSHVVALGVFLLILWALITRVRY